MVTKLPWWHDGIIYQIYLRSFYDANGDGIGDIAGVTAKLPYLANLGVTALWLSPVGVSANRDWGYDVVNYCDIDPALGTMAELEALIATAKSRGIRIVLDLVPNHTSTAHPWFQAARRSRTDPKRDWYLWADRPNNWRSVFGGSAWRRDDATGQYYLHNFLPQQADLNWENPEVQAEFERIMRFWFARGVSGFRIDVVNMLAKDHRRRNNPKLLNPPTFALRLFGQDQRRSGNGTAVHRLLRTWRQLAESYREPRLLLGETMVYQATDLARFYGHNDELHLAFNYPFWLAHFRASALRQVVAETERALPAGAWPVYAASNHDIVRAASRWAKGKAHKLRLIALMLLTLRGTPVLYYGEELGLTQVRVPRWHYRDSFGKRFWPFFAGRDGARTPMVWNDGDNGGFSAASTRPWLPLGSTRRNVRGEQHDKRSLLAWTQALIALRQGSDDLRHGTYHELPASRDLWVFQRGESTLIILNFSGRAQAYRSALARNLTPWAAQLKQPSDGWTVEPWSGIVLELA